MKATKESVEAGRKANQEARQAGTSPEVPDVRTAKRSSASNRLLRPAPFPGVTLTIPFKHLVADNAKYGVIRGRMLLRAEYRAAKDTIQHIARRAMRGIAPTDQSVALHATLYMPDARRRDATNYVKLVHDSMQGAVYLDDTQIKRATWEHGGIDRENPRCDITITTKGAA